MKLDVNFNLRFVDSNGVCVSGKLDQILHLLNHVVSKEIQIMANLADVQAAVTAQSTVIDGVVVLLNGLKQKLDEAIAANDPVALQALSDQIAADTKKLSDAVVADTPAAPAPAV